MKTTSSTDPNHWLEQLNIDDLTEKKTTSSTDPHRWTSRIQGLVGFALLLLFLFLIFIIFIPEAQAATCDRTLMAKVVASDIPTMAVDRHDLL